MSSVTKEVKTNVLDRRIILVLGGFFVLFGVYILAFMLPDFIASAAGPTSMPLAEAAAIASDENSYVQITDGEWRCDSIHYIWGRSASSGNSAIPLTVQYTEAFMTQGGSPQALLVLLSGEQDCAALQAIQPTGYLTLMSADTQQELTNEARMARFSDKSVFMEMCGYCGTDNAIGGVIGGSISLLLGVGILLFARRHPQGFRYATA